MANTIIGGLVSTEAQLDAAVGAANAIGMPGTYEIRLAPSATLSQPQVVANPGVSIVLDMQGSVTFGAGALSGSGSLPYALAGFVAGDAVDLGGITGARVASLNLSNVLTVTGVGGTVKALLQLDAGATPAAGMVFGAADDGAGGTSVTLRPLRTTYVVGNAGQLDAALNQIDLGGSDSQANTGYTISLANGFTLDRDIYAINLDSGDTLTIQGNGATIDGGGAFRGLFDYAGTLVVNALTIANAVAAGGAGGAGAGGGAGLGGGLFVGAAGSVTLNGVSFARDSARGGAGGGAGESGGGGGGLGGAGGGSGGGGIGAAAAADNNGGAGGPGIVLGVNPGIGSSVDGGAGTYGGGGGIGNDTGFIIDPGFGGGTEDPSRTAGFGGGGGARDYFSNGSGGFGGGGAVAYGAGGGQGGFGGGGGSGGGGFGGGNGNQGSLTGGGGLGAGGDVFVEAGGQLAIGAGSLGAANVAGGSAGGGAAGAGQAYGSGIFLQGQQTIALAPGAGMTLTIAGAVDEQTGAGSGSLLIGAGLVRLQSYGDYSGGTTLEAGGTLELAASGAAGGGPLVFDNGPATLRIDAVALPFAGQIQGVAIGDTIDLRGIGTATAATMGDGNQLTISGGGVTPATLNLIPVPLVAGEVFGVVADGAGGTALVLDMPLSVGGLAASQGTTDEAAALPFAGFTLGDPLAGRQDSATVTFNGANGTLGGAAISGTYTLGGTAAAIQQALRALTFTPAAHETIPGQSVTTRFAVSVSDGVLATAGATAVVATAASDTPAIAGTRGGQGFADLNTINPFTGVSVTDPDLNASEALTITLSGGGRLSGTGLTGGAGTYTLAGGAPSAVSALLAGLVFAPAGAGTTGFSIIDATNHATSAIDVVTTVTARAATRPFATLLAGGADALTPLSVVARVSPEPGTFSDLGGGTVLADGTAYSVTGTAAQVNAALHGVVFTPSGSGPLPASYSATLSYSGAESSLTDTAGTAVRLVAGGAGAKVVGGGGADTLVAAAAGTRVVGGAGANVLIGNANGASTLVGGSGGALFLAEGGPTLIFGGSGRDTVSAATGVVTVVSGTGGSLIGLGNGPATVFGRGPDTITGGGGAALIVAAPNSLVRFGAGNAVAFAGTGDTVVGGGGNDLVVGGGPSGTSYVAGSGPSTFYNVGGAGTVTGGSGADTVVASGASGVLLNGGSGPTTFFNGSANSTVMGGAGSATVIGGAGGGWFQGGAGGGSLLIGGQHSSTLVGGGSGDSLYAEGSANTPLMAGSGNETLNASDSYGSDSLFAGAGADVIGLGQGADTVYASTGTATVLGGAGPDVIAFQAAQGGGMAALYGFKLGVDALGLFGYGATAAQDALATASVSAASGNQPGGVVLTLPDATRIVFAGWGGVDARVFG